MCHGGRRDVHGRHPDLDTVAVRPLRDGEQHLLAAELVARLRGANFVDPGAGRVQRRELARKGLVRILCRGLERARLHLAAHTDLVAVRNEALDVHREAGHGNHGRLEVLFRKARLGQYRDVRC